MLGSEGDPLIGTESADFLLARTTDLIEGRGGNDIILGDTGDVYLEGGNDGFGSALDLDHFDTNWSIDENSLVADDTSTPHTTVYVAADAGQEFFKIFITAGETITIDIDGGGGALGGVDDCDIIVDLFHEGDVVNAVAGNDDSAVTDGGYGSVEGPAAGISRDSFLTFTAPSDGLYYIRIGESDSEDGNFEGDEEFLLNVSLSGHVTGPAVTQNADIVNGDDGDDHLFGAGGGDNLRGDAGNDLIFGGSGDDAIDGGAGADRLDGGSGMDFLGYGSSIFGDEGVTVNLATGFTSGGYAAGDIIVNFEGILGSLNDDSLTGDANANYLDGIYGDDMLFGAGGDDQLFGSIGNDVLDGGEGADRMSGAWDNDTYIVDNAGDVVIEAAGLGHDTVYAQVSYALTVGYEVEVLAALNPAGTSALDLTGDDFDNRIEGNEGVNSWRGEGGDDTLFGFGGNDTYFVDSAGDLVTEAAGGGSDSVIAKASFALAAGQEIELLRTTGSATIYAVDLTGNELANAILGNAAANVLDGKAGADLLRGYGGDDTYYVDNAGDSVIEDAV